MDCKNADLGSNLAFPREGGRGVNINQYTLEREKSIEYD